MNHLPEKPLFPKQCGHEAENEVETETINYVAKGSCLLLNKYAGAADQKAGSQSEQADKSLVRKPWWWALATRGTRSKDSGMCPSSKGAARLPWGHGASGDAPSRSGCLCPSDGRTRSFRPRESGLQVLSCPGQRSWCWALTRDGWWVPGTRIQSLLSSKKYFWGMG